MTCRSAGLADSGRPARPKVVLRGGSIDRANRTGIQREPPVIIDPTAYIAPGAVVLGDVHIGKDSSVWYNSVLRGDTDRITIGEATNIQDLSMIHADPGIPCIVGNRVTVGHRVILHGCTVEDDCLIGMGAVLLNGARIGRGSVIGAAALVLEGTVVPPDSVVVGFPAKVLRQVDETARARIEHAWVHYVDMARSHRAGTYPTRK
jgi:carbonic anhydrase/acetyltransferase-like protein (isoleucine patch superfamily)